MPDKRELNCSKLLVSDKRLEEFSKFQLTPSAEETVSMATELLEFRKCFLSKAEQRRFIANRKVK